MTIWPSVKANFVIGPLTCGRTVTVASGVTVPSAFKVIGIGPWLTFATPTGVGPPIPARPCTVWVAWVWASSQMSRTNNTTAPPIQSVRRP